MRNNYSSRKDRIFLEKLFGSQANWAIILIRFMIGGVFLSEGIQKFLFSDTLGIGRFAKIGIPYPEIASPFVGGVEILCGALILLGLFTRLACIPLIIDISVAILVTKLPIFIEKGFWPMAHETRTDFCMLLGSLFLLIEGAGRWSIDYKINESWIKP